MSVPLKIACISTSRVPSVTANSIQVMKACQALARIGHTVRLLLPAEPGKAGRSAADWDAIAEQYGLSTPFDISWLPANPRLKRNDFAWTALRSSRRWGADLIYTWTGQSALFALLHGLPVIYEVHDLPTGRLGPLWFRGFLRLPGRKRLLLITQALLDRLRQAYGPIQHGVGIIAPNGVDLEQYEGLPDPPTARAALELPEAPTVLCSGHLYAGRGAELFLELARRFPLASFVWVGGQPQEIAVFQQQAAAQGLENLRFTGFVSQRRLPLFQAAADILLMPYARSIAGSSGGNSADICSPMKMFDYLAAGRAILSSDLPVIHEVLNPGNATFALPEDAEAWSAALGQLLSDPNLRQRIALQASCDARQYTWAARAQRALAGFLEK